MNNTHLHLAYVERCSARENILDIIKFYTTHSTKTLCEENTQLRKDLPIYCMLCPLKVTLIKLNNISFKTT